MGVLSDVHWYEKRTKHMVRMKELGFTQRSIAERYCISVQTVRRILRAADAKRNKPEKTK